MTPVIKYKGPIMKVREIYNSKIPRTLGVGAITLYPFIFYPLNKTGVNISTRVHEFCHVAQIKNFGFCTFYISYCLYYLLNLIVYRNHHQAYSGIPWEIKAYEIQQDWQFHTYLLPKKQNRGET